MRPYNQHTCLVVIQNIWIAARPCWLKKCPFSAVPFSDGLPSPLSAQRSPFSPFAPCSRVAVAGDAPFLAAERALPLSALYRCRQFSPAAFFRSFPPFSKLAPGKWSPLETTRKYSKPTSDINTLVGGLKELLVSCLLTSYYTNTSLICLPSYHFIIRCMVTKREQENLILSLLKDALQLTTALHK